MKLAECVRECVGTAVATHCSASHKAAIFVVYHHLNSHLFYCCFSFLFVKKMLRRVLSFLLFVPLVAAQNTTDAWEGCNFPSDTNRSTEVKIGEPTPVCITIGPGGSWAAGVKYVRWLFTPKADMYSYFSIPNCKLE